MGLEIFKYLARIMNGNVYVDNEREGGNTSRHSTQFRRDVPSPAENKSASTTESAEAILKRDYKDCRILLVDDDTFNRDVALGILEEIGQTIDIARDGVEAVELAGKNNYDLILMDIQMPRLDGLEATRQIRMQPDGARVSVFALTASSFAEDKKQCFEAGMNEFITKPVDMEELFSAMLKWLSKTGKAASSDAK